MGCICSKGAKSHKHVGKNAKESEGKTSVLGRRECNGVGNETAPFIQDIKTQNEGSIRVSSGEGDKNTVANDDKTKNLQIQKVASVGAGGNESKPQPKLSERISMPNGEKGAQIVAGWPSWLVAVAGEAISGWLPRKADSFEKLEKVRVLSFWLSCLFLEYSASFAAVGI